MLPSYTHARPTPAFAHHPAAQQAPALTFERLVRRYSLLGARSELRYNLAVTTLASAGTNTVSFSVLTTIVLASYAPTIITALAIIVLTVTVTASS